MLIKHNPGSRATLRESGARCGVHPSAGCPDVGRGTYSTQPCDRARRPRAAITRFTGRPSFESGHPRTQSTVEAATAARRAGHDTGERGDRPESEEGSADQEPEDPHSPDAGVADVPPPMQQGRLVGHLVELRQPPGHDETHQMGEPVAQEKYGEAVSHFSSLQYVSSGSKRDPSRSVTFACNQDWASAMAWL